MSCKTTRTMNHCKNECNILLYFALNKSLECQRFGWFGSWCFPLWLFLNAYWENAKVTKKWISLLCSIQISTHFLTCSNHAGHWKGYTVTPPDIHGSSIFWVMCLSNLYIKRNVSQELKLLRSEIIAFVHSLSLFSVFSFAALFFLIRFVPAFPLPSRSLQTLHICHSLTFFLCLLSKDHEDGK